MLKKTAYSFLFFLCLQFVLFSCCKEKTFNIDVTSIQISQFDDIAFTTTSEDLRLVVFIQYNFLEVSSVLSNNFNFNTALATTCPDDIYNYLFEFTNLNITADTSINGIEAGQSLNDIMKFSYYDVDSLQEISEFYNPTTTDFSGESREPRNLLFVFDETITSGLEFKLTVTIETSNQDSFTATSELYTIE